MREIKFRAWDGKRYWYWGFGLDSAWFSGPPNRPSATQEQYTGLKDKNGVEIYEGDIVKTKGFYPSDVNYKDGSFWFNDFSWIENDSNYPEEWWIIGNIHENPELLNG